MIQVYGFPQSRSTRIVWLLEELGVDYGFNLVDFLKMEHRSPEFLAVNPAGKVPAIVDGDLVMTESGAIVAYLADRFAEKGLIPPAGTQERAAFEQWSYFALCELEQPLWTMGKHKFALPEEQRVAAILPTAEWEFQKALALLSEGLGDKPYILGKNFSAADILLGHTLFWGMSFKQSIEQPNLQAYAKRLQGREALARAKARESASSV